MNQVAKELEHAAKAAGKLAGWPRDLKAAFAFFATGREVYPIQKNLQRFEEAWANWQAARTENVVRHLRFNGLNSIDGKGTIAVEKLDAIHPDIFWPLVDVMAELSIDPPEGDRLTVKIWTAAAELADQDQLRAFAEHIAESIPEFESWDRIDREFVGAVNWAIENAEDIQAGWLGPFTRAEIDKRLKCIDKNTGRFAKNNPEWFRKSGERKWEYRPDHPDAIQYLRDRYPT